MWPDEGVLPSLSKLDNYCEERDRHFPKIMCLDKMKASFRLRRDKDLSGVSYR